MPTKDGSTKAKPKKKTTRRTPKKSLVIVESPSKAKTIEKYLGNRYKVMASLGHIRDLPKSKMGIDVENNYEPHYISIRGKGDVIKELRKEAKKADHVYLAADPDREGEAIAWHLSYLLGLDPKDKNRVVFNEITKDAVKNSFKTPRAIDMNLVDAQQARRALDRLVGYSISPLLWSKIKKGLSAGRVQSIALNLIIKREKEIRNFKPEEYWTIDAEFKKGRSKFEGSFYGIDGKKTALTNNDAVKSVMERIDTKKPFTVANVEKKERKRQPPLPFTTSTMQQVANNNLKFRTQKTMMVAQQLYEGINIGRSGTVGLITYMRTDSTRISEVAKHEASEFIHSEYGENYAAIKPRQGKLAEGAQDAHEAIRPTDVSRMPALVKESLSRDQFRLYQLIWKRFVASRMQPAIYETTSVKISGGEYLFTVAASKIKFDGFMSVYVQEDEEKAQNNTLVRSIDKDTVLNFQEFDEQQHFTQPPAHYTEASLVKTMEELGIGRPSTYAPTITTIIARRYVAKENKNLYMTELGEVVNQMMKEAFPSIVDVNFTATMEDLLDKVGDGTVDWKVVVRNFYPDLDESVKEAEKNLEEVKLEDEVTDVICENCGRNMVIKYGPHGRFLACPGFPDCRNTKPYLEKIGVKCPKCGKEVVLRKTKKGRKYYGCEDNPECDFMSWAKPINEKCPKCGGYMVEKGNKKVCADEQCGYVEVKEK